MTNSAMFKRFQAAAPASAHTSDKVGGEVRVYRIRLEPTKGVRFERVSLKELAKRSARVRMTGDRAEQSPALKAQIRESYEAHLRGDSRPVDDFMAELEAELNEQ